MTMTALPADPQVWQTASVVTGLFVLRCVAPLVVDWLSRHVFVMAVRRVSTGVITICWNERGRLNLCLVRADANRSAELRPGW